MVSLGEMIAYLPIPGGHIKLAERFVDPAFSFTMGVRLSFLSPSSSCSCLVAHLVELLVQLDDYSPSRVVRCGSSHQLLDGAEDQVSQDLASRAPKLTISFQ
jgi:hypothetical protein